MINDDTSLYVTKSFLPPLDEYTALLNRIWQTHQLTNGGTLLLELIDQLRTYVGTERLLVTTNGTLPIQIALQALQLTGEVITTPFSYIATSASLVWQGIQPVFVDIDPTYWSIDERKIEQAITAKTSAILATHVYGNPCNVGAIARIADQYHLPVIYDAAHAFGTVYQNTQLLNYGDVSTCSFHATKVFHTGEGGCFVTQNRSLYKTMLYMHNAGHDGLLHYHGVGINAKATEMQAAMGLAVLPYLPMILAARQQICETYDQLLSTTLTRITLREGTEWNYSYYPILFDSETQLSRTVKVLHDHKVFPRRYFYPALNTIEYLSGQKMPVAESIARRILCLPLYVGLDNKSIERIAKLINHSLLSR